MPPSEIARRRHTKYPYCLACDWKDDGWYSSSLYLAWQHVLQDHMPQTWMSTVPYTPGGYPDGYLPVLSHTVTALHELQEEPDALGHWLHNRRNAALSWLMRMLDELV